MADKATFTRKADALNNLFDAQLREGGLELDREYKAVPTRRFLWDFAAPDIALLIEIQGGTWSRYRSGHSTGSGIRRDAEKNNLAVLYGWSVLYFTSDMIRLGSAYTFASELIRQRRADLARVKKTLQGV